MIMGRCNISMAPPSTSGTASAFRTSPSLLLRVQGNDQDAWTRLVNLYAPLVYHWCRRAGLDGLHAIHQAASERKLSDVWVAEHFEMRFGKLIPQRG